MIEVAISCKFYQPEEALETENEEPPEFRVVANVTRVCTCQYFSASFEYLVTAKCLRIIHSAAIGNQPRETISGDNEEGRRENQQQSWCAASDTQGYIELPCVECY